MPHADGVNQDHGKAENFFFRPMDANGRGCIGAGGSDGPQKGFKRFKELKAGDPKCHFDPSLEIVTRRSRSERNAIKEGCFGELEFLAMAYLLTDDERRWVADHMAETVLLRWETSYGHTKRAAIHGLLYRNKQPAPVSMPPLPTFKLLHGVEQAVMRSEPVLKPSLMTAVKGNGVVNTHHANQDQGSFLLYAHGDCLLIDPGYFEPQLEW